MPSKGAKPKRKPFLDVGAPGPASPSVASGMYPDKGPQRGSTPGPAATPGGVRSPLLGEPSPTGRPKSNLGKYLIKPSDTTITGYEMLNDTPDAVDEVHKKFLRAAELPTHLRPTRFLSPVLERNRALNISRGWRKPRSRAG